MQSAAVLFPLSPQSVLKCCHSDLQLSGGAVGGSFYPSRSKPQVKRVDGGEAPETERRHGCHGSSSGRVSLSPGMVRATLTRTDPRSDGIAVLMEVEGVLADVHRFGHRQGFNKAFQELGLDCVQWTEAVLTDLQRSSGGVEEKMLKTFFTRIGWPAALPTNEQDRFVQKVLQAKAKAMQKLVASDDIPLRPGLEEFADEVLEAGVPLVVLGAYYKRGEQFARLLLDKLGSERASRVRFVGEAEVENSAYGQLVLGDGVSSSFDEYLAVAASTAVAAERQRIAAEVASVLKLSVEIDTNSSRVTRKAIAALRAGAEIGGVGVDRCILLASGHSGSEAAYRIGMPCVVIRSSLTARAEFPAAKACLDSYGPGSTTLARLLKYI